MNVPVPFLRHLRLHRWKALALFLFFVPVRAADWYVAPTGDDAGPGSLAQPFATLPRAQRAASPGDTVYLGGGTYRLAESSIERKRGPFAQVIVLDKSGTREKPITYRACRDEHPVFDFSAVRPRDMRVTAFLLTASWLQLIGLEVTGVQVTLKTHTQSICFENNGSHNVLERLRMHDGQAIGIYQTRGSDNLYLNCDAWNNWDFTSENGKGGNVDGFGCHPAPGGTNNVFRGCRAWFNSDDGYDCLGAAEAVIFENCWALYNGYSPDFVSRADGNGFKAGGYGSVDADALPKTIPRHLVRLCVAAGNKNSGFYANHHPGGIDWYSNSAFRNGTNFNMQNRLADNRTEVDGYGHRLINNLAYGSRREVSRIDTAKCQLRNNSFLPDLKLADSDFLGTDEKELLRPRMPNGDLPAVNFMHLAPGCPLIDAGAETGRPKRGLFPDIGAFEADLPATPPFLNGQP